jgi:uncharacterized coiled-coil DUF342 family protein
MKNEDKIVELLAEYLLKTDRALANIEALQKQTLEIQKQTRDLQQQTHNLQQQTRDLQQQTRDLQQQTHDQQQQTHNLQQQSNEFKNEMKELRGESLKHEIRNDVLLKEILSISKRVLTLEEKANLFG